MSAQIRPLRADEVEALGQFLREGFHAPEGAAFAAPEVLRWKYVDPRPGTFADAVPRSWVACDDQGALVGHVGIWPTQFLIVRPGGAEESVSTLHMLDWLGKAEHRGIGARLMRQVHGLVETQYAFGGTAMGRQVVGRSGYQPMPDVPVFRRVLRPSLHWREGTSGGSLFQRFGRAGRDAVRLVQDRPARTALRIELEPVDRFGPEIDALTGRLGMGLVIPGRQAAELNVLLAYPRGGITGWTIHQGGELAGFAVLSVQARGAIRTGKIADLFLNRSDVRLWHAAALALTRELVHQQADDAVACGSTPWMAEGVKLAGFRQVFPLQFQLRDRSARLPRDVPYHLGFIEADYATLP